MEGKEEAPAVERRKRRRPEHNYAEEDDLDEPDDRCPSKQFLNAVAQALKTTPRELYIKFLKSGEMDRLSMRIVGEAVEEDEAIFNCFFKSTEPWAKPSYFDIMSLSDAARFEKSCLPEDMRLVYMIRETFKINRPSKYFRVYDGRVYPKLVRGIESHLANTCLVVYDLKSNSTITDSPNFFGRVTEYNLDFDWEDWNFSSTLQQALGSVVPEVSDLAEFVTVLDLFDILEDVRCTLSRPLLLVSHRSTRKMERGTQMRKPAANAFNQLGFFYPHREAPKNREGCDIVLVTVRFSSAFHQNGEPRDAAEYSCKRLEGEWASAVWEGNAKPNPGSGRSRNIRDGYLPPKLATEFWSARGNKMAAIAKNALERKLMRDVRLTARRSAEAQERLDALNSDEYLLDDLLEDNEASQSVRAVAAMARSEAKAAAAKAMELLRDREEEERMEEESGCLKDQRGFNDHPCPCMSCCDSFRLLGSGVSSKGPQKRQVTNLTAMDYLRWLGLDTEENRNLLNRAFDLSVAAFDIEALTRWLEDDESEAVPFESVSGRKPEKGNKGVQEMLSLGYGDSFCDDKPFLKNMMRPEGMSYKDFLSQFYDLIRERAVHLSEIKESVLAPITSQVEVLENAQSTFFVQWELDHPSELDSSDEGDDLENCDPEVDEKRSKKRLRLALKEFNRNSLVGKFSQMLKALIREMRIFSFNGSKYDHPMIFSDLMCLYKENNVAKPYFDKVGSAVKKINLTGDFITFHDIQAMLSPTASLDSFSKLCGLEIHKGIFPFDLLTSRNFLKEKKLPSSPEMWFSKLKQTSPSAEKIEEALRDFEEKQFANVGEYLDHYLEREWALLSSSYSTSR